MKFRMNRSQKAFTLVELLIVMAIIVILVVAIGIGVIGTGMMGNQWYSQDGVLKQIKMIQPNATEVSRSERHVFSKSKITVKLANGEYETYMLDSNLLYNYSITPLK